MCAAPHRPCSCQLRSRLTSVPSTSHADQRVPSLWTGLWPLTQQVSLHLMLWSLLTCPVTWGHNPDLAGRS